MKRTADQAGLTAPHRPAPHMMPITGRAPTMIVSYKAILEKQLKVATPLERVEILASVLYRYLTTKPPGHYEHVAIQGTSLIVTHGPITVHLLQPGATLPDGSLVGGVLPVSTSGPYYTHAVSPYHVIADFPNTIETARLDDIRRGLLRSLPPTFVDYMKDLYYRLHQRIIMPTPVANMRIAGYAAWVPTVAREFVNYYDEHLASSARVIAATELTPEVRATLTKIWECRRAAKQIDDEKTREELRLLPKLQAQYYDMREDMNYRLYQAWFAHWPPAPLGEDFYRSFVLACMRDYVSVLYIGAFYLLPVEPKESADQFCAAFLDEYRKLELPRAAEKVRVCVQMRADRLLAEPDAAVKFTLPTEEPQWKDAIDTLCAEIRWHETRPTSVIVYDEQLEPMKK